MDRVQGARQCHEIKRRDCGWNSWNSVLALYWILDRPPTPSLDARHLENLPSPPSMYLTHFHNPFLRLTSLSLSLLDRVTVSNTSDYFALRTRNAMKQRVCRVDTLDKDNTLLAKIKKKKTTLPLLHFRRRVIFLRRVLSDTCCNYESATSGKKAT